MKKEYRMFTSKLNKNGYNLCRMRGDHAIFKNVKTNETISININPNKMVMQRLEKEHNLQ